MAPRRFDFPDGSQYDVLVSGDSTHGARMELEVTLAPGSMTAPPHVHPQQEETCSVVEGTLETLVGREWRTLTVGQTLVIPPGTVHTCRNKSDRNVTFRCLHAPALDVERYLERLYWLSAMNRIRRGHNLTSALYGSLLLDTHRNHQVLASPSARISVRALAGVARLLRMRVDRGEGGRDQGKGQASIGGRGK